MSPPPATVEVSTAAAGSRNPTPPQPLPPPPAKASAPVPPPSSLLHHHSHAASGGSDALPAPILRRVVRVDAAGVVSHVLVDRYILSEQLGLPFRDLRVLDPKTPSTAGTPASALPAAAVLIRERALGFAMEGVRAIVCADQVLVLSAPTGSAEVLNSITITKELHTHFPPASLLLPTPSKHPHAALAASPFVRDLCARIKDEERNSGGSGGNGAGGEGGGAGGPGEACAASSTTPSLSSAPLPYELRATEAVLLAAVRRLDGEIGTLEAEAGPDLDRLGGALGRDDLLRLRGHKAALGRLLARAAGVRGALESLLDDDTDLANLYLGRRAARVAAMAAATAAVERVVEEEGEAEGAAPNEEGGEEVGVGGAGMGVEADAGRRGSTAGGRPPSSQASAASTAPPAEAAAAALSQPPALLPRTDTGTGRRATLGTARGTDCGSDAGTAIAVWARGAGGFWFGNAAAREAGGGGGGPPHHPSLLEECEGAANLLDAYATLAGGSLARLEALRDRVASTEALVRLELDRRRNELVAFNMFLSMVAVCVGVISAIGSVFGQNLYFSSHETPLAAWHAATWGSVGVAAAGMTGLLAYARRHNLLFIPTPDE